MPSEKLVQNNIVHIDEGSTASTKIKRVVVTSTETRSRRQSANSSLDTSFEAEEWERKPKTDYTYAKTASYMKYSPTKGYPNPNMSRRSLHSQALYEASQPADHEDTFFSSTQVFTQEAATDEFGLLSPIVGDGQVNTRGTNINNANNEGSAALAGTSRQHRMSRGPGDQSEAGYRYADSTTRSGTFYGVKERLLRSQNKQRRRFSESTVTRALAFDETDAGRSSTGQGQRRSNKYYEKQMEYAGEAIPYKEAQTPLHNLYGLDRADIARDVVEEGDTRSDRSISSVVTTTTAVIRSAVSSSVSGVYRLMKTLGTWIYTLVTYVLVLTVFVVTETIPSVASGVLYITRQAASKVKHWTTTRTFSSLWESHSSRQQQISPSVSMVTTKETSVETTLQRRRKTATQTATQTASQASSAHWKEETEVKNDDRERQAFVHKLAKIVLFVPSLIYAYVLYPCYLVVVAVGDSVRFGSTGLLGSLKYCCTAIKDTTLHLLSYITSLWSSTSRSTDLYQSSSPTGSELPPTGSRMSPRLGKSVTFDLYQQQEEEVRRSRALDSASQSDHKYREYLYRALVFLPNTLYAYILCPVSSGGHTLCQAVWSSILTVYHTVLSGCGHVVSGVGSVLTSTYNWASHWGHKKTTHSKSTHVITSSKAIKQRLNNRRYSQRLKKQLEFSDAEELTDSEDDAGVSSYDSSSNIQGNRYMQWLLTVVMFIPSRLYGSSLSSLGSSMTQRSESAQSIHSASASSVTMETSSSKARSTLSSTAVSRRMGSHVVSAAAAPVAMVTVSLATEKHSRDGFTTRWCDQCLAVLLFVPRSLLGIITGAWRVVKYVCGGFQGFTYWLFVERIGGLADSGRLWMTKTLQTVSSYLILTDVWILSRSRRCGLCCLLPLLLLLPFLLCGSYYVYDQGRDAVVGGFPIGSILAGSTLSESSESQTSSSGGSWWPWLLLAGWFRTSENTDSKASTETVIERQTGGDGWVVRDHTLAEKSGSTVVGGVYLNEQDLQAKIREVFVAMYGERQTEEQVTSERASQQILVQQTQILNQYKVDVEEMTKQVVKEELAIFATGINNQRTEDLSRHTELVKGHAGEAEKVRELQEQYAAVVGKSEQLVGQIQAAREKMILQDEEGRAATKSMVSDLEGQLAALQADIAALQGTQANLMAELRTCCKNDSTLALLVRAGVRDQLSGFMAGPMGGGQTADTDGTTLTGAAGSATSDQTSQSGSAFTLWLQNQFAKRDDLDSKIAALAARLNEQIKTESEAAALAAVVAAGVNGGSEKTEKSSTVVLMGNGTGLTEEQVKLLIREALYVFGADKTGMVDYALESAGGSVISTRCSETYHRRTAQLSLFGIPLWYASNSPRTVIQPEVHPGQCWAFRGSHGYLVVHLAGVVKPSGFSLEHIPKSLSPTGKIDSAPREFSVRGLNDEKDSEGVTLGEFVYDQEGEALQYFTVKEPDVPAFAIVELMIHSNWGNEEYTCLYRFRVHGQLHKWMPDS